MGYLSLMEYILLVLFLPRLSTIIVISLVHNPSLCSFFNRSLAALYPIFRYSDNVLAFTFFPDLRMSNVSSFTIQTSGKSLYDFFFSNTTSERGIIFPRGLLFIVLSNTIEIFLLFYQKQILLSFFTISF